MYIKVCGDEDGFCKARCALIHAGFTSLDWNISAPGNLVDGAWWQCWSKDKGFHAAMFINGGLPIVWACDSGKSGYFMLRLYQLTKDKVLLEKASLGAEFLLRIQQPDGDLEASVYSYDAKQDQSHPM